MTQIMNLRLEKGAHPQFGLETAAVDSEENDDLKSRHLDKRAGEQYQGGSEVGKSGHTHTPMD